MRLAGVFLLIGLLAAAQLAAAYTTCRNFMAAKETCEMPCSHSESAPQTSSDDCRKMCEFGQKESPAVPQKTRPEINLSAVSFLAAAAPLMIAPPAATRDSYVLLLANHALSPTVEVYLLNSSLLI